MHRHKNRLKRTRSVHPVINTHFKWVKLLQNNNPSRKANQPEKTNPIHPSHHPIAPHPTPKTQQPFEKTNPISTHTEPRIRYLYYLEHAKLLK